MGFGCYQRHVHKCREVRLSTNRLLHMQWSSMFYAHEHNYTYTILEYWPAIIACSGKNIVHHRHDEFERGHVEKKYESLALWRKHWLYILYYAFIKFTGISHRIGFAVSRSNLIHSHSMTPPATRRQEAGQNGETRASNCKRTWLCQPNAASSFQYRKCPKTPQKYYKKPNCWARFPTAATMIGSGNVQLCHGCSRPLENLDQWRPSWWSSAENDQRFLGVQSS